MHTLFGRLMKKTKSGQAAKANTARQLWTLQNFQFVEAHLAIWTETRQLGRVLVPTLPVDQVEEKEEEEGGDDDDTASRSSIQLPSTQWQVGWWGHTQAGRSAEPQHWHARPAGKCRAGEHQPPLGLLPVDGPGDVQAWWGAVDKLHAWLVQPGGALQEPPGPSASTSSSSSSSASQLPVVQPQQQQSSAFVHPSSAPQLRSPPSFRWRPTLKLVNTNNHHIFRKCCFLATFSDDK